MTVPKLSVPRSGYQGRGYKNPITGAVVPGVTSVLGAIEKPGIVSFHVEQTIAYAVTHLDDLLSRTEDQGMGFLRYVSRPSQKKIDEIDTMDDQALQYSRLVLDDLAEIGTWIHSYIEADLRGWFPPDPVNHIHWELVDAYEQLKMAHVLEPTHLEVTIFGNGYAGTADFMGSIDGVSTLGDWKGLPLDTRLPTPEGWTTMSDVQVGDFLFDERGKITRVAVKSEVKNVDCYRLTFDTGENVVCDADHRWVVNVGESSRMERRVMTAREMAERGVFGPHKQRDLRVPVAEPLELPEEEYTLDPYVLGVWLGDGTRGKNEVTLNSTTKAAIPTEIRNRGWDVSEVVYPSDADRDTLSVRYRIGQAGEWTTNGISPFKRILRDLGVVQTKHIPAEYLRGSIQQRLDLLRGLMDTDGSWNTARKGEVSISTTDGESAKQFLELVSSLGERAYFYEHPTSWVYNGETKWTTAYQVRWKPTRFNPFLAREYPYPLRNRSRSGRRIITRIEQVESVPTQCIEVGSPDHTFLFGDSMIVTHNTSRAVYDSHEAQLAALGAGESLFREVPEGTPDAIHYQLPPSVAAHYGGQVDSWWVEDAIPGFEQYAMIQVRPDDDDRDRFSEVHVIDQEIIEAGWDLFQAALGARHAQRRRQDRMKQLEREGKS